MTDPTAPRRPAPRQPRIGVEGWTERLDPATLASKKGSEITPQTGLLMSVGLYLVAAVGTIGQGAFTPGWMRSFDPDANDGRGQVTVTTDPALAAQFDSVESALAVWNAVPAHRPVRDDGKPNRPLRAFDVEIRQL